MKAHECPICGTENNHCHSAYCIDNYTDEERNGTGKQPEPIDFIKWLCERAEGFEYCEGSEPEYDDIKDPNDWCTALNVVGYDSVLYPLLLKLAVRTVVLKMHDSTEVEKIQIIDAFCSDEIAEQWLKYIWEQERSEG